MRQSREERIKRRRRGGLWGKATRTVGLRWKKTTLDLLVGIKYGLVPAIQELLPEAEHRCCARHIYAIWRKKYPGASLKVNFWRAAKSNNPHDFRRAMLDIRKENKDAHTHLVNIPPKLWSKAYFQTQTKCDVVTNNMSECFNSWILEARYKPLITMFEDIKIQVMGRIHSKRDQMAKHEGKLCPRIMSKVNKVIELTKYCDYEWDGGHKFEVSDRSGKYKVDLEGKSCSCGVWQLSGIPCNHGVVGILHMEQPIEIFVDSCYYIETYLKSYHHLLNPMGGSNEWPPANMTTLLPPVTKRIAGRPKKNRRRDPNEEPKSKTKSSRKGIPIMCSRCKEYGHNKLGCRNTPVPGSSTSAEPTQSQLTAETVHMDAPQDRPPKLRVKRKSRGPLPRACSKSISKHDNNSPSNVEGQS